MRRCASLARSLPLPGSSPTLTKSDSGLPVKPEVPFGEHTTKNSEIQEILRPAGDGGPGIEQQHGRRERKHRGDGRPAAPFEASHPEQRRGNRRAGVPRREERFGLPVADHPGRHGDAGVGIGPERSGGLLVHPDGLTRGPQRDVRRGIITNLTLYRFRSSRRAPVRRATGLWRQRWCRRRSPAGRSLRRGRLPRYALAGLISNAVRRLPRRPRCGPCSSRTRGRPCAGRAARHSWGRRRVQGPR